MGTPAFAVPSLTALLEEHEVVAVYTRPDRPVGRGRHLTPSAVKVAAMGAALPVEQPESLHGGDAVATLSRYRPDIVVVAAFGLILPRAILEVPPLGCVNVHASLLPRHRGAAPVERAILEGDDRTGVSIMRMEEGLDTGPWAMQVDTPVDDLTADHLRQVLSALGASALAEVLRRMGDGRVTWTAQSPEGATYAAKITAADTALDPALTVQAALRRVRAGGPTAPCRALLAGRSVTVEVASRGEGVIEQGVLVLAEGRLLVGLQDGAMAVDRLVPAGRRSMSGAEYARGARIEPGATWGSAT